MGNNPSINEKHPVHSAVQSEWSKEISLGSCDLVRSHSGLLGEMYTVDSTDKEKDMEIYRFRYDNPDHIVTVYSAVYLTQELLCATNNTFKVIIERIPYRLGDIGNVGYAQGLYLIEEILKSAQILTEQYLSKIFSDKQIYYVEYEENMVCLTDQGHAKLWVNEQICLNAPKMNYEKSGNLGEESIVEELMTLIQSRMSGKKFINYLKEKVGAEKIGQLNSFSRAIDYIQEMRAKEHDSTGKIVHHIVLPNVSICSGPKEKEETEIKQVRQISHENSQIQLQKVKSISNLGNLHKPPRPEKQSSKSPYSSSPRNNCARITNSKSNTFVAHPNFNSNVPISHEQQAPQQLPTTTHQNIRATPSRNDEFEITINKKDVRTYSIEKSADTSISEAIKTINISQKQKQKQKISTKPFEGLQEHSDEPMMNQQAQINRTEDLQITVLERANLKKAQRPDVSPQRQKVTPQKYDNQNNSRTKIQTQYRDTRNVSPLGKNYKVPKISFSYTNNVIANQSKANMPILIDKKQDKTRLRKTVCDEKNQSSNKHRNFHNYPEKSQKQLLNYSQKCLVKKQSNLSPKKQLIDEKSRQNPHSHSNEYDYNRFLPSNQQPARTTSKALPRNRHGDCHSTDAITTFAPMIHFQTVANSAPPKVKFTFGQPIFDSQKEKPHSPISVSQETKLDTDGD